MVRAICARSASSSWATSTAPPCWMRKLPSAHSASRASSSPCGRAIATKRKGSSRPAVAQLSRLQGSLGSTGHNGEAGLSGSPRARNTVTPAVCLTHRCRGARTPRRRTPVRARPGRPPGPRFSWGEAAAIKRRPLRLSRSRSSRRHTQGSADQVYRLRPGPRVCLGARSGHRLLRQPHLPRHTRRSDIVRERRNESVRGGWGAIRKWAQEFERQGETDTVER